MVPRTSTFSGFPYVLSDVPRFCSFKAGLLQPLGRLILHHDHDEDEDEDEEEDDDGDGDDDDDDGAGAGAGSRGPRFQAFQAFQAFQVCRGDIVVCYTGFGLNVASCKSSARHDDSASPCLRTRVCVCLLCPLFLRVSLPSIYSFLSLFVC